MIEPLLIRAFKHEPLVRPPVWIMRQAGRYLSEYRTLRQAHSFLELCKSPELAAQVTMQPIHILDPDAAIIFSDILVVGEGMGLEIDFNPGPKVANPIRSRSDILALKNPETTADLGFVFDALRITKKELWELSASKPGEPKALIGFAGAPWTLACYFLDQSLFKNHYATQVLLHQDAETLHLLLDRLTKIVTDYLLGQVEHGADVIQLFDTWAGNLSAEDFSRFALPCIQRICEALRSQNCPVILYINGCAHLLEALRQSGADGISIDWRVPLSTAEEVLGNRILLQGNLDPAALYSAPEHLAKKTKTMLNALKRKSGYIANLGHGILPTTPRDNARLFIDTIKEGWE
ncbi:MAG TPA: uroporphyrinogen decarboxylase [Oligoflexia bacterium]|mgnify:CR=1 FL=1|nr:uroporphyrinogen decarboxylase [Oligoflexia bacterium]